MSAYLTSKRAAEILSFLNNTGPCPEEALAAAFGPKAKKALLHLLRTGRAFPLKAGNITFWAADGRSFDPVLQVSKAWFAARLHEAGGRFAGGTAFFPKGQAYATEIYKDFARAGPFIFYLEDLKTKNIRDCVRRERNNNNSC